MTASVQANFVVKNGLTVGNTVVLAANGTFISNLTSTGVASGTYGGSSQIPVITVGADGRLSTAANVTVNIPSGTLVYANSGQLTSNSVSGTGNVLLGLATTGVSAGYYGGVTSYPAISVDQYGRITSVVNVASSTSNTAIFTNVDEFTANGTGTTFVLTATPFNANNVLININGVTQQKPTFTLSGSTIILTEPPVNGATVEVAYSYNSNNLLLVANTTVTPGTYGGSTNIPVLVINQYGQVTSASNTSIYVPPGTAVFANSGQLTSNSATGTGNVLLGLATVGTAGTYANANTVAVITTDAYGRVSAVTNTAIQISIAQVTGLQGVTDTQNTNTSAASSYANSAFTTANSAGVYANGAYAAANASFGQANSAASYANSAFATANSAGSYANSAFATANSAGVYANGAYAAANASFSTANNALPKAGGTMTGTLYVSNGSGLSINTTGSLVVGGDITTAGNLYISGNVVTTNAVSTLNVSDPIIYLAANNSGNAVDIGLVGHFVGQGNTSYSHYQHTGFVRDYNDNKWKLFSNVVIEPTTTVTFDGNTSYDTIKVGVIEATSSNINGYDLLAYSNIIYTAANSAGVYANGAYADANAAFSTANAAGSYANSAFATANSAGVYANGAYAAANASFGQANSAASYANSAFSTANSAGSYANAAFLQANSAYAHSNTTSNTFVGTNGTTATPTNSSLTFASNNGISVSGTGNTITISSPQDLRTTASPSFVALTVNTFTYVTSTIYTTGNVSQNTIDQFSVSTYRSAKYQAQMTSGSAYHMIELNVISDGTTPYLAQYGEIFTSASLGTFDVSITAGTLYLLFTPANAVTTVKLMRTAITV
jgi:hypothetical protein